MTDEKHYLHKELDALIMQSPDLWNFVQQSSLDGVWYWDLENPDHEWMSPEYWKSLGIDPSSKEHDPKEFLEVIFEEDLASVVDNLERHYADPSVPYEQMVRFRHADGSTVWVRCRGMAIRDETGKAIRMLGAHNDLTAVKSAELNALQAKAETEASNEELRSFAYSVSHDLKAPSNTIYMLLNEVLESDDGSMKADQLELLTMAVKSVQSMRDMIEDLLEYTRLIGQTSILEPIDLNIPLRAAIEDLGAMIEQSDADISVGDLAIVSGHKLQLHALFQNLISNAIKFSKPGTVPTIKIDSAEDKANNCLNLWFNDRGIGIASDHFERIFKMFNRLHRADEIPGAGLGLTLCRRIVANHGGEISVSSELGEGTTFHVTLPKGK